MKKYKVRIPKGYEVANEYSRVDTVGNESIVIDIVSIKKKLSKTWIEYCEKNTYPAWLEDWAKIPVTHKALGKLEILRDVYNDGWKPDYKSTNLKFRLEYICTTLTTGDAKAIQAVLTFRTEKIREEFLSNFRELIETAKPLL